MAKIKNTDHIKVPLVYSIELLIHCGQECKMIQTDSFYQSEIHAYHVTQCFHSWMGLSYQKGAFMPRTRTRKFKAATVYNGFVCNSL